MPTERDYGAIYRAVIHDPIFGPEPATPERLRGVAFYTERPENLRIFLGEMGMGGEGLPYR